MAARPDRKLETQVGRWQPSVTAFWPFDQPQRARAVIVGKAQVFEFFGIEQPVKIEMHDMHAGQFVSLDQRVARTLDRAARPERTQYSTREGRLARAELARQFHHAARRRGIGRRAEKLRAERLGFFAADRLPFAGRELPQGLIQPRSSAITSLAMSPRCPPCAAESPASACTSTPTRAASAASSICARRPAMTPVSTSPIPAVAMPGLPRSQIQSRGSSTGPPATSVPAPLSTQTAP